LAVNQLVTVGVSLVLATVTAIIAVAVDAFVALVAIVGVVAMAVVQSTGIRPAHRLGRLLGERNRELQAVVTDSLDSLRLARAHDAAEVWVDRMADAFGGAREVQLANTQRMSTVSAMTSVGGATAAAALVGLAVWAGSEPASIVLIVILLRRLSGQVGGVVRTVTLLANSLPAVGDIIELTAAARSACELPGSADDADDTAGSSDDVYGVVEKQHRSLTVADGAPLLEFRDVGFTYPTSGGGVRNLNFVVRQGQITALSGPSGSGKSTTADLALGLLRPDIGEVLVNGQPLRASDLAWWRSHIAYVPQDPLLLPGSLRNNLVWSVNHGVTDDECRVALDQAAAHFATVLPDGLDTLLGDRGVYLSGGERQRVAIARALLRKPALLVLDEATSALDDDTEAEVLETIASLVPAITVLVIAHRRTTLDRAHHVIRIGDGPRNEGQETQ
jgi:ATP-binding cassette subfamily C protein